MLILTRRKGETIVIDDNIRLTVLEVKGNQCKIGIDAPSTVEIHREEIYNRIQDNNTETEGNNCAQVD